MVFLGKTSKVRVAEGFLGVRREGFEAGESKIAQFPQIGNILLMLGLKEFAISKAINSDLASFPLDVDVIRVDPVRKVSLVQNSD